MEKVKEYGKYSILSNISCDATVKEISKREHQFDLYWESSEEKDPQIVITYDIPCINIEFGWWPTCLMERNINLRFFSMTTASAPIISYCDNCGKNVYTIAVSEIKKRLDFDFSLVEENACIRAKISIGLRQFSDVCTHSFVIYENYDSVQLYHMCDLVRIWWEQECCIKPIEIPENATLPMYSTWYSYHQGINALNIEAECKKAKNLGMTSVIVDDGWQTDGISRDYAFCGDWEPCKNKIPDMKKHVDNIHKLGMNYILWFSVPFVGINSKSWNVFKNQLLTYNEELKAGVLDPRYPAVRNYLIDTYENALKNWNLDGLKLDFIDNFKIFDDNIINEDMDYECVQDATDRLMTDILHTLKKIKKDVLIEFRQGYIGPNMRKYGNMFRVVDCPNNYRMNRVCVADLRMLSGNTAVHSDMLMWNENESIEGAALQILNVIFSVIQFSVKIDSMDEDKKKMVEFWLGFSRNHKKLLLEEQIKPQEAQNFYPVIMTENDEECITAVYEIDKLIKIDTSKKNLIINACLSEYINIVADADYDFQYRAYDCMGNEILNGIAKIQGGTVRVKAPECGLLVLN